MFIEQRKKKNHRTFIYAAVIIVLCLTILVVAWPSGGNDVKTPPDSELYNPIDHLTSTETPSGQDEDDDEEVENPDIAQASATYYLVRRDGSQVKVYFIDETGNLIELETTEIIYEMLGPEDQKLFDEGYRVDTQEQLAVLLQDFES